MHSIITAIASIMKACGNAIKKCFVGIKNLLLKLFRPLAHFILLLCKGIYIGFKYFIMYIFIKPILFLYHYVVLPVGRGLYYIFSKFYKYVLLPPLHGIKYIFKKIGQFFVVLYYRILSPIGRFFANICKHIFLGVRFACLKIEQFILLISKLLFYKMIKPIWNFIVFIGKKIGLGIEWLCLKIYAFFEIIFRFIYNTFLHPIGYLIYYFFKYIFLGLKFIVEKIWFCIYWFFSKVFWVFHIILKFLFYKIIKPIALFIYHSILKPIGHFLKFIFTKLYHILIKAMDKLLLALESLGKWIWRGIKFIYQCISVAIVVTLSSILCLIYTLSVYPFRVLKETKAVAAKEEYSIIKRLFFNSYFLCLVIKEQNLSHCERFKKAHPDLVIFIQIKNWIAILPTILYSFLLYPLNYFLILIFYAKRPNS